MSDGNIILLKEIFKDLHNADLYDNAIKKICEVANTNPTDLMERQLLYDCFIASRVYWYLDTISWLNNSFFNWIHQSISDFVPIAVYWSNIDEQIVLTRQQKEALDFFQDKRRVCISAPTSFWKTFVLFEILCLNRNIYNNIIIIVPTVALSLEIYHKLKRIQLLKDYSIINSTEFETTNSKNIFIFTPEKTDMFLDKNTLKIDFFAIDEVYKICNDEDRSDYFDLVLYRLANMVTDFYLIWPYIKNFDPVFCQRYNIAFKEFKTEIVSKKIYKKWDTIPWYNISRSKSKISIIRKLLTDIPNSDQYLIYSWSKKWSAEKLALDIIKPVLWTFEADESLIEFSKYLEENYHKDWSLPKVLSRWVAFHHWALPKYIQKEIIDRFNSWEIKVIVCTSTIIEWVNTSAKKVIVFDSQKWPSKLSKFDSKNIYWRAGRFIEHFVWEIVDFDNDYIEWEEDVIKSSYSEPENLKNENFLLLNDDDIHSKEELMERATSIKNWINSEIQEMILGILDVFKKNKFIPIQSQINLINHLLSNPDLLELCYIPDVYTSIPRKAPFEQIFMLISDFLLPERHKKWWIISWNISNNQSKSNLNWAVNFIINGEWEFLRKFIGYNLWKGKKVDVVIRNAFSMMKEMFWFILPRYIKVFENIYNAVAEFKGKSVINLDWINKKLEFWYDDKQDIVLYNMWVPPSIIKKLKDNSIFNDCNNQTDFENKYQKIKDNLSLNDVEKKILDKMLW